MGRAPLRQPLRTANRQRTSVSVSIPSGTGGWNGRDPWDQMKPEDAIILDNFIPTPGKLVLRNGYQPWATGLGGQVETGAEWAGSTSRKSIAAANGNLWDVTANAAATSLASGFISNRWQTINFKGRLFLGNGNDAPQDFDGATMSATAWTGPSANSALIQPNVYRSRIYWTESGSTKVWYGGVEAIQGALTSFDVGGVAKYGGYLFFTQTWSRDTGAGSAEYLVFFMSTGEVLVYNGAFPSDATWTLVARFKMGAPLSIRAAWNIGPELVVLTYDGLVQFSKVLSVGRDTPDTRVSDKLGSKVSDAVGDFGVLFGWEGLIYPNGNLIIVNVPATSGTLQYQFVMHTVSKAWCRFTGINANTFWLYNNDLYFGGTDGKVYKADTGRSDNGANILGDLQTAYNYCGNRASNKSFELVRPIIFTDGSIMPALDLETDFQSITPTSTPSFSGASGTPWDTALWDTFKWGAGLSLQSNWVGVNGLGYSASIRMQVATNSLQCTVQSFDIVFQRGDFL
jgi:hypothetical protein